MTATANHTAKSESSSRRRIMSVRRTKLKLTDYRPDEKSISGRVAEFLHWAGESYPQQVLTYEEITQAIFGLGKLPPLAPSR